MNAYNKLANLTPNQKRLFPKETDKVEAPVEFSNLEITYSRAKECFYIDNLAKDVQFTLNQVAMKKLVKTIEWLDVEDLETCNCPPGNGDGPLKAVSVIEDRNYHLFVLISCYQGKHSCFARIYYKSKDRQGEIKENPTKRGFLMPWMEIAEEGHFLSDWVCNMTPRVGIVGFEPKFEEPPNVVRKPFPYYIDV